MSYGRGRALKGWFDFIAFILFAAVVLVIYGLLRLLSLPLGVMYMITDRMRSRWKYRRLSRTQRKLIRSLQKKLHACEEAAGGLDAPSPLDGVMQVQSLQLRNQWVMERFEVPFREALAILGECRRANIEHDVLQPIWEEGLAWVKINLEINEIAMQLWRRENPLSPMLGAL